MPKRTLLFALVLFSFINGCAYGGGWILDFLVPRSDPGDALHAIAQQWIRERGESPAGSSNGRLEVIKNPLGGGEDYEVDLNHLRRLIGWNALVQEIDALMDMPLGDEDVQRRECLIRKIFEAFCRQFGCEAFPAQIARIAALESQVLKSLQEASWSWPSLRANITNLIGAYERHVWRNINRAPVGYWNCLVRYLSQAHVSAWLELLREADDGLDAGQSMERNLVFQSLLYVRGIFNRGGPLYNYFPDFSLNNRDEVAFVLGNGSPIILQIRRAEALDGITMAMAGGNATPGMEDLPSSADDREQKKSSDKDDRDKSGDQDDEIGGDDGDSGEKDDDNLQVVPSNNENESDEPQMLEAAHAYIAWRALQAELRALVNEDVDEGVRREWVHRIMPRFINAAELGYVRGDDWVALQEQVYQHILGSENLAADWDQIEQEIEALCEGLLAQFSPLLKSEEGKKILVEYWKNHFLSPAISALWGNDTATLGSTIALTLHGQRFEAVNHFFDVVRGLEQYLTVAFLPRFYGAFKQLKGHRQLMYWRQKIAESLVQILESNRLTLVEAAEREGQVIGGDGVFSETLLPPELWLQILNWLFRLGSTGDVIRFISSSMYLHGIALAPRYERVYNDDGTYVEVPATMNEFTRLGCFCLESDRYEDAFRYFAYMGCLGVLLEENFSGMLQSILRMRSGNRESLNYSDLCVIVGPQNALYTALLPFSRNTIVGLEERIVLRNTLIHRVMDIAPRAQAAHDVLADSSLSLERRTHALTRLQALLRCQNDQHIPIDHIWEMHTVVLTAGFTMEQVQSVIDVLKNLCLARMESKRKIDVNMVGSILTDLLHIAGDGGVYIVAERRIYALEALMIIIEALPMRYFESCKKSLQRIIDQYGDVGDFSDQDLTILQLSNQILAKMNERRNRPKIIEVTDDSDEL